MLKRAMRIRFNEILKRHELTPYKLASRSNGRISPSTAYRLARLNGEVSMVSLEVLEALMEVAGCSCDELFEK